MMMMMMRMMIKGCNACRHFASVFCNIFLNTCREKTFFICSSYQHFVDLMSSFNIIFTQIYLYHSLLHVGNIALYSMILTSHLTSPLTSSLTSHAKSKTGDRIHAQIRSNLGFKFNAPFFKMGPTAKTVRHIAFFSFEFESTTIQL